jgi:hypothetical protein
VKLAVENLISQFTTSLRSQFPANFPDSETISNACITQQPLQKCFSSCIDEHLLETTLSNPDLNSREKARLRSVSSENAARWLSAAPNTRSFKYFEDNQFSALLRYWLGIPIFNKDCRCKCGETVDCFLTMLSPANLEVALFIVMILFGMLFLTFATLQD